MCIGLLDQLSFPQDQVNGSVMLKWVIVALCNDALAHGWLEVMHAYSECQWEFESLTTEHLPTLNSVLWVRNKGIKNVGSCAYGHGRFPSG